MTTIPPASGAMPPHGRANRTREAGPAAASFASFLDNGSMSEGRDRVQAFSALGMFGRPRAVAFAADDVPSPDRRAAPPLGAAPEALRTSPEGAWAETGAETGKVLSPGLAQPAPTAAVPPPAARPAAGIVPGPVVPAAIPIILPNVAADPAVDVDGTDLPDRAPVPDRQADPASTGPSLIVAERDGVLQIVARDGDDTPEARARLRRLVERIAAEFGLAVGRFHLNGAEIGPSHISLIGDPHGDRTR